MGIIYRATNILNRKSYIGQTIHTLDERKYDHILLAKNGSKYYFHRALRRYGNKNFLWEIIEECDNEQLDQREMYYIDLYGTLSKNKCGYNMTPGGKTNFGCSGEDHWLKRMDVEEREQWINENRRGDKNPNFGNGDAIRGDNHYTKKFSPDQLAETLDKISGDNNYQKKLTAEERKGRHWIHKKTKEEIENFKNKCRENNKKIEKNESYYEKRKINGLKHRGKNSANAKKYVITFPNGEEYIIFCFKEFVEKYKEKTGINLSNLIRCVNGSRGTSVKGYKLRRLDIEKDVDINNLEL